MSITLNDANLPYPDPLHPIVVHFVIAMVVFSFICDVLGYFTGNSRLFEVSWWNLFVAAVAIFVAIIFGQFEAGLAQPYPAAQSVLTVHTIIGWSLSAIVVAIASWRFIIRRLNPVRLPPVYLLAGILIMGAMYVHGTLGAQLGDEFGIHNTAGNLVRQGKNPNALLK